MDTAFKLSFHSDFYFSFWTSGIALSQIEPFHRAPVISRCQFRLPSSRFCLVKNNLKVNVSVKLFNSINKKMWKRSNLHHHRHECFGSSWIQCNSWHACWNSLGSEKRQLSTRSYDCFVGRGIVILAKLKSSVKSLILWNSWWKLD